MPAALTRSASPELRASLYQFTVYLPGAVSSVFLGIWLSQRGLPADQIGIVNAVPMLCLLAVNMLVGRLADRAKDWRNVIIILSLIGAAVPVGLFFVNEFWGIVLVWALCTMSNGLIPPIIDAATVRMTRRNGSDFGTIRAWGTVGYMLFNALTGFLVVWYGSDIFVPLFVGLALLRAVVSLQLPAFRAPPGQPTIAGVRPAAGKLTEIIVKPWFFLPLVGFSLIYGTHHILNAFGSLLWKEQGISESIIGPLIALGSASEAAMMFAWRRFGGRVSARHMILIAALASVLRWGAMAFSPPVAVLVLLQLTHGLSFALGYLGCVHFIANWTSEDIAAETQSLFTVAQQVASVAALVGFGWAVGLFGAHAYFFSALAAIVGALCIWLSLRMVQPKDDTIQTG